MNAIARFLAISIAVVLLAGCDNPPPPKPKEKSLGSALDPRILRPSTDGQYRARFTPETWPPPLNQVHQWQLQVQTRDGRPVEGLNVHVDGDMPLHRHGLPSTPQVQSIGPDGTVTVDGLLFHMPGSWRLTADIQSADGQPDTAVFDFHLDPGGDITEAPAPATTTQ